MHDFFNMVVVLALIIGFVMLRRGNHRSGRIERMSRSIAPESREAELEEEVAELRQRIAVLERIATEERKSRQIAAEIDALRD